MVIEAGTLVDLEVIVMPAGERAPQVPEDTAQVDLVMRVKGRLISPTEPGSPGEVETPVGRRIRGKVLCANPPYTHGFGEPVPELLPIGAELRRFISEGEAAHER